MGRPAWRALAASAGLAAALALYTVVGGIVLSELEWPDEVGRLRAASSVLAQARATALVALADAENDSVRDATLRRFEETAGTACRLLGADPSDDPASYAQWHYLQAIFFASTILTTIGYGHIVPETTGGRAFCVLFAIVGIPLALSVLARLGAAVASCLPRVSRRSSGGWRGCLLAGAGPALAALAVYMGAGALLFAALEGGRPLFDWFYFCFITMTTIGLGDIVPQKPEYVLFCMVYILIGLALTSTIIEMVRREYEESWRRLEALAEAVRRLAGESSTAAELGDLLDEPNRGDWEASLRAVLRPPPIPEGIEIVVRRETTL